MAKKIFLPEIKNQVSQVESDRDLLYSYIQQPPQGRKSMQRNSLLDLAAQNKAIDMATRHYFSHTSPDGVSANANIRSVGYRLPDWYPIDDNNCESWALVSGNPEPKLGIVGYAIKMWKASPVHFKHIFGQDDFYAGQECVGVGVADTHVGGTIFVFISCPCESN